MKGPWCPWVPGSKPALLERIPEIGPIVLLPRFLLVREQNDAGLALRYFESASGGRGAAPHPRVAGGQWRALLAEKVNP